MDRKKIDKTGLPKIYLDGTEKKEQLDLRKKS